MKEREIQLLTEDATASKWHSGNSNASSFSPNLHSFFFFFFFFCLFVFSRATLAAYGGSQARGPLEL